MYGSVGNGTPVVTAVSKSSVVKTCAGDVHSAQYLDTAVIAQDLPVPLCPVIRACRGHSAPGTNVSSRVVRAGALKKSVGKTRFLWSAVP
jgi:hypothetical protein